MIEGSASVIINRPIEEVFDAIVDVTRIGEFSPECMGCRWVPPATGAAVGAEFEGDNIAKAGPMTLKNPMTLKKWTTTSDFTDYAENATFAFTSAGYTNWRYEFETQGGSTKVTESYTYPPYTGWPRFMYETVMKRAAGMVDGMQETLDRIKTKLEA
jgi:uncharacterized protein YndB with AHSA1/START domain